VAAGPRAPRRAGAPGDDEAGTAAAAGREGGGVGGGRRGEKAAAAAAWPRSRQRGRAQRGRDAEEKRGRTAVVSLSWYLGVGALLFAISVIGIFLNRRNLIVLLMA